MEMGWESWGCSSGEEKAPGRPWSPFPGLKGLLNPRLCPSRLPVLLCSHAHGGPGPLAQGSGTQTVSELILGMSSSRNPGTSHFHWCPGSPNPTFWVRLKPRGEDRLSHGLITIAKGPGLSLERGTLGTLRGPFPGPRGHRARRVYSHTSGKGFQTYAQDTSSGTRCSGGFLIN